MMSSVNLFVVGAAKCGTTSLASYLNQHPDIFVPVIKEPKYFSVGENVFPHNGPGDEIVDSNVASNLEQYEELYSGFSDVKYLCDSSVDYLYFDNVAARIHAYNNAAKILIMLRNPVDRAYSAYMHMVRDGRETLPYKEALMAEEARIKDNWEFFWRYLDCGMYSEQVKRYLEVFPAENIKIILFENFVLDPDKELKDILVFLGIEDYNFDTSKILNISGVPANKTIHALFNKKNIVKAFAKKIVPNSIKEMIKYRVSRANIQKDKMSETVRYDLKAIYQDDVLSLGKLIGRELSGLWK